MAEEVKDDKKDFTVFERTFDRTEDADGMFIRLTCDEDNELQHVRVKSILINESLGLLIPTMIIDFIDGTGDFVNHNRLNTDAIYTLYFGKTMIDACEVKFKIFNIHHGNGTQGRSKNVGFKVIFSQASWEDSIAVKKNRGWADMLYSDVIKEVLGDKGFKELDIEESNYPIEQVTQINIADGELLTNIRSKATPKSADGYYVFCGTLDNRFFFKSTFELIEKGMQLHKEKKMVVLRLGGQPSRQERDKMYSQNEKVPVSFTGFGGAENYAGNVSSGASGVQASYYDWHSGSYTVRQTKFSEINSTQLSEWSLIREATDYISKKVFGGRSSEIIDEVINKLSETSMTMQDVTITLEGQTEVHCGDIVEIIVPTNEDSEVPYNELYSGFYMVTDIEHLMTLSSAADFVSKITLTRNGMDAKDMKGYVRSKKGKVVTE